MLAALDAHALGFAVAGLAVLGGALWPVVVRNRPLSTPILSLLLGIIAFALPTVLADPTRCATSMPPRCSPRSASSCR